MAGAHSLYEILKRPIYTEKSSALREEGAKVVVEVATWASKYQIKEAVKKTFNVDVVSVNTLNRRGKVKRVKNSVGKRANVKRAYLTLKNGADVDLFGAVGQEIKE